MIAPARSGGGEFAVADIAVNDALDRSTVATYTKAIREGGDENGAVIGALGIIFDWQSQSQTIVDSVRLTTEEKPATRCFLVDRRHRGIAASDRRGVLAETVALRTDGKMQGAYTDERGRVVGCAPTPGYETYRGLGWYGVIVREQAGSGG